LHSRASRGGSESQKGVPAEADGAVHSTPAARAAAAPTVAVKTLGFMFIRVIVDRYDVMDNS
jgi:hypothetical protein